jgi:two-component system LytT family sensor kinase
VQVILDIMEKGIELLLVSVEGCEENRFGSAHDMSPGGSCSQSGQGPRKAILCGIGHEPVICGHMCEHPADRWRHAFPVFTQNTVHAFRKTLQGLVAITGPVAREEVVIEHVHHNARITAGVGTEPRPPLALDGMCIGIAVDGPVQPDAMLDKRMVVVEIPPLHAVRHEIADDHQRLLTAQIQMPEIVHPSAGKVLQLHRCGKVTAHGSNEHSEPAAGTFAVVSMMRWSSLNAPLLRGPRPVYWVMQLASWSLFVGLFYAWQFINDRSNADVLPLMGMEVFTGISVSHLMRHIILRRNLVHADFSLLLPQLALYAVLLAPVAIMVEMLLHDMLLTSYKPLHTEPPLIHLNRALNWGLLFIIWSVAYLAYCYFIINRREEIRNLKLETANRENQLSTLRAQMNPHFMFNALNGIRALVDEDPEQAKRAITQLSAILRNAMASVRRRTVPLGEEIDIVKAYLALESMRYEERLRTRINVDPSLERNLVPPMLLQTLVENAVRHGIAHLPGGGQLVIDATGDADATVITVRNSGTYRPAADRGGIGLQNTRRRLALLYGSAANLSIREEDGSVVTTVNIPLQEQRRAAPHQP